VRQHTHLNALLAVRAILILVALLAIEFLLLFLIGPAVFAYTRHRIPAIPALWVLTAYCVFLLLHDPHFDRRRLGWRTEDAAALRQCAPQILGLWAVVVVIGIVLILKYAPGDFLNLPRSNPLIWALVMVLYPTLSVYPQGIVYRVFLFERYRAIFGAGWGILIASAAAFVFVHIVFRNPLALILTFLGGVLFGLRYWQTGSLFVSSFEHALYGCAIFTIGIGRSFYHAAVKR
jgi:membrane protease YdiL (CAAX protease family)